jgi:transcription elongation factor Elf1
MPSLIDTRTITCPHCWEEIEVVIDASEATQSYIEDCSVCCRPIAITVNAADGEVLDIDAAAAD